MLGHLAGGITQTHMCRFLMTTHIEHKNGEVGLVKKTAGFMSSRPYVLSELDKKCVGYHEHFPLVGGRAAGAAIYLQALCEVMCKGIRKQKAQDQSRVSTGRMQELCAGYNPASPVRSFQYQQNPPDEHRGRDHRPHWK